MGIFKKKIVKKTYDREHMKPVIRASICTGEEVAGFKDIRTGKIEEIFWPFGKEIVYGNGTWKPGSWLYLVHYDSWNSIWKAVFQDGKTLLHAIWGECNRVEYVRSY